MSTPSRGTPGRGTSGRGTPGRGQETGSAGRRNSSATPGQGQTPSTPTQGTGTPGQDQTQIPDTPHRTLTNVTAATPRAVVPTPPLSSLQIAFDGRQWTYEEAVSELERIGNLQPLPQAMVMRGQQLVQHIHLVLSRYRDLADNYHITFVELSERFSRIFTNEVRASVNPSIQEGKKARLNQVRIGDGVRNLLRRAYTIEWQLTQLVPSLMGVVSRGLYEHLRQRNIEGASI